MFVQCVHTFVHPNQAKGFHFKLILGCNAALNCVNLIMILINLTSTLSKFPSFEEAIYLGITNNLLMSSTVLGSSVSFTSPDILSSVVLIMYLSFKILIEMDF